MANGVRVWFDYIFDCSVSGNIAPCISECSDFQGLNNYTHTSSAGGYSNTISDKFFGTADTNYSYPISALSSNISDRWLFGLMVDTTRVANSEESFVGINNSAYCLGSNIRYLNVYFGGVGKGISFDIRSAYASGGYAMMKANHMIKISDITSIDLVGSALPLYTLNTDICQGDGDCVCDGVNVCETMIETNHCKALVRGKDWTGNDVQELFDLNFANSDSVTVNFNQNIANVTNVSLYCDDNTFMGNGVITCKCHYYPLLNVTSAEIQGLIDCATGGYISCFINLLNALGMATWDNPDRLVGTFTFDNCSKYASFNPDSNFMDTSARWGSDLAVTLNNLLYPSLEFEISAGFEGVYTCEECCCDTYDNTVKSGGNGTITIIPYEGGEGGEGGESGGGSSGTDDCVCEWLSILKSTLESKLGMINDTLLLIKSAIEGLKLECNTTVEPSSPIITVEPCSPTIEVNATAPQVTVEPCSPVVQVTNPVNNVTVEPCSPVVQVTNPVNNVTVEPCSPIIQSDYSSLVSAIETISDAISNGLNLESLYCQDSFGNVKSIACILEEALIRHDNGRGCNKDVGIAEILHESLNVFDDKGHCEGEGIASIVDDVFKTTYQNEDGDMVTEDITEVIRKKEDTNVIDCIVEPVNMAYEGYGKYVSKEMLDESGI